MYEISLYHSNLVKYKMCIGELISLLLWLILHI